MEDDVRACADGIGKLGEDSIVIFPDASSESLRKSRNLHGDSILRKIRMAEILGHYLGNGVTATDIGYVYVSHLVFPDPLSCRTCYLMIRSF